MADNENIGGVGINVTADFSDLDAQFDAAVAKAQSRSDAMAQAIQDGVKAPDVSPVTGALDSVGTTAENVGKAVQTALNTIDTQGFVSAFQGFITEMGLTGDAADKLQQRIEQIWTSGSGDMGQAFAQALKDIGDSAQASVGGVDALGSAVQGAVQQINGDFAGASAGPDAFNQAIGTAGDTAAKAGTEFQGAGENVKTAGQNAHDASGGFAEFAEKLAAIGEALAITEGLIEFGKEALAASDAVTKVSIALTTITGDASAAEEKIKGLEALGMSDGLSFPSLYTAGTRLQQLLGPGADVVGMLGKIADGAAVIGTDINTAATKFATLVENGNLSVKAMKDLGLNFDLITAAMNKLYPQLNATADSAKNLFQNALNDNGRIAVLQTALEGLGGTAQKVADETFGGQWQRLENQWEQVMAEVGKALMPAITALTDFASQVASAVKEAVDWFNQLSAPVKEAAVDFGLLVAAIVPVAGALGGVALALSGLASLGEVTAALFGLSGGFAAIGEALLAVAPEVIAFSAAAAAIHFSGLDESVLNFFDSLRGSLTGLADLFSPIVNAAGDVFAAISKWSGLSDIVDAVFADIKGEASVLGDVATAATNVGKSFNLWDLTGVGEAKRLVDGLAASLDYLSGHYKVMSDALGANNPVMLANNKNMHDAAQAAMEAAGQFDKHKASTDGLKASVDGLQPSLVKLAQATHDLVDNTTAATDPTNVLAANEAAAGEKIITLTENLGHANANLLTAADNMAKVAQQYKDGSVGADAYTKAQQQLADAAKSAAAEMENLTSEQIKFANAISARNLNIDPVNKALSDMDSTLKSLGPDLDLIPPKMSPLNQAMIDAGVNTQKAKNAFEDLHTPIATIVTDMDNLIAAAQKSGDWSGVLTGLDNFDKRISTIAKTDLPEAVKEIEAMIDELNKANAPAGLIAGQLDKFGGTIEKMAQEQLPGWHQAWQTYLNDLAAFPPASAKVVENLQLQIDKQNAVVDGLKSQGAAYGDILDAQGKLYQSEITLAEKQGTDASAAIYNLEAVKLKQDALKDSADGLATTYVKMFEDINKGFDQMASAMADAIVNGNNLGDALIGVFKKIAASILNDLIAGALKPLESELKSMESDLFKSLGGGSGFGGLFGGGGSAASETAGGSALPTEGNPGDYGGEFGGATTVPPASAGGGAGGAAGAASGIGGALSSGPVAGGAAIVQAGAAVASAILLGHISSDTGHIEVNTREAEAELQNVRKDLWSQFGSMYDRLGEVKNDADAIKDTLIQMKEAGGGGGFPDQAMTDLNDLDAMAKVVYLGWPTMQGALQTIASDIVTGSQYILSDLDVMVGKLGTIVTLMMAGNALAANAPDAADVASAASDITAAVGDAADQAGGDLAGQTQSLSDAVMAGAGETGNNLIAHAQSVTTAINQAAQTDAGWIQQQVAASRADAAATLDVSKKLSDLKNAYDGYEALMQQAIQAGDLALAEQYRTAAANVMAEIQQVQGDISGAASLINDGTVEQTAAMWTISGSSTTAIVGAVNAAASTISAAVGKAYSPVNFAPTGPGQTTSTTPNAPYVGPNPYAGSTPSPTGGGGFSGGATKTSTNSPANIPGTVITGSGGYDPNLPDPTKPKPPYVPPSYTFTSPTSDAAAGLPTLHPQPVATQAKPLPTDNAAPVTSPPTAPIDPAIAAVLAQLAADQTIQMQVLKDLGNAADDDTRSALQKQANEILAKISADQTKLAELQQQMVATVSTGGAEPNPGTGQGSGSTSSSSSLPTLKGGPVQGPPVNIPLQSGGGEPQSPISTGGVEPAPVSTGGVESAPVPVTVTNPIGTTGSGTTSGPNVDSQTLGFYASTGAELEDIRNTAHIESQLIGSMRDSWVAFQSTAHNDAMTVGQAIIDAIAAGNGGSAKPLKSFDMGGPVASDMVAQVHAGEEVLPPDIAGTLRRMLSTPSSELAHPNPASGVTGATASGFMFTGPITLNVTGVQNGKQLMQEFTRELKRTIPNANGYTD